MAQQLASSFAMLTTPLASDELWLKEMTGVEGLSRPFEYRMELASRNHNISADELIGMPVGVCLSTAGSQDRYFHGMVREFSYGGTSVEGDRHHISRYRALVVPWFDLMKTNSDCRIFQGMSVPEIIREVFETASFSSFNIKGLRDEYKKIDYCVQYRESDFNFVSRLMEREGITYHFRHHADKHVMVLSDSPGCHKPWDGYEKINYLLPHQRNTDGERIDQWQVKTHLQPGHCFLMDYDYKNSRRQLHAMASPQTLPEHQHNQMAIYDYPGKYFPDSDPKVKTDSEGKWYARRRIEAHHAQRQVVESSGNVRGLIPGYTFKLSGHPREDQNRAYLVTEIGFHIRADEHHSGSMDDRPPFECRVRAIDADTPFRPPVTTPRPTIPGAQTAVVVGPPKEEIHTDEFRRVKVRFHWDRRQEADDRSSCWIRVSQAWAGRMYGALYTPRVGQEVIVEFLEGDPDQPIITGRVYNDVQKPPYHGKDDTTVSGIKSETSKGGGGFNEIRFDDKQGEQLLSIQAEKDSVSLVKNDNTETVGHDETISVGNDQKLSVASNQDVSIGQNRTEKIGVNATETVGVAKVIDVGSTLLIKAGTSITLQCGASAIHMNQAGFITISGTVITTAAAVNASMVAPMTEVVGGAMLTLAGAVVMQKGGVVRIDGSSLMHVGGSKVEVVGSGETIVKGAPVKVN